MSDPREIWVARPLDGGFLLNGLYSSVRSKPFANGGVRYIRADEHDRLKAQADALYAALGGLFVGMVQHANQEGPGPTGADMLAAEEALRGYRAYRGEGGER